MDGCIGARIASHVESVADKTRYAIQGRIHVRTIHSFRRAELQLPAYTALRLTEPKSQCSISVVYT
jgi:hypothetical protein